MTAYRATHASSTPSASVLGIARPVVRRLAPLGAAIGLLGLAAVPALATSPTIVRELVHRERPFIECPSGTWLTGTWDVERTTMTFYDASGTAVSDSFTIQFRGTLSNPATGASVPDSGRYTTRDQLAPDGSVVSSTSVYQRTDAYLHEAGQQLLGPADENGDQTILRTEGISHFDSGVPALCAALGA